MINESSSRLRVPLIDETSKGWRVPSGSALTAGDVAARGWNALRGDLELPTLLLHEQALAHNVAVMSDYCRSKGVELAPHAKTSMSPEITRRQLEAGAWAVTAATPGQVRTLHAFGAPRILMANVLVDVAAIRWVAENLLDDGGTDFLCYVDSQAGVELLDASLTDAAPRKPVPVLLEVGFSGGRTGVRSRTEALRVAERAAQSPWLQLAGVAGFEGLIPGGARRSGVPVAVSELLGEIGEVARSLHEEGLCCSAAPMVVTAGGSSYFDQVVEFLSPDRFAFPVRTVLRSGCYVTHDHGLYHQTSPLTDRRSGDLGASLRPAFELLASVWSRPEPDLVIVGFGRRDVPTDDRLPMVLRNHSRRGDVREFEVTAVNDQHAFLRVPPVSEVAVGDVLGIGVSHPCGAFDRWRQIPVVDERYDVVSSVATYL